MDLEADPAAPVGLSIHQLALPLASAPVPTRPTAPAVVAPAQVWASLPPTARDRVARAVRMVFLEVAGDADRA